LDPRNFENVVAPLVPVARRRGAKTAAFMAESVDDDAIWRLTTTTDAVERTVTPPLNGTAAASDHSVFQSIDLYVTPIWYVLGVPGNLLAYCVWMQRKMRRSSGVYLASLALDECLFLVIQVPPSTVPYYYYYGRPA